MTTTPIKDRRRGIYRKAAEFTGLFVFVLSLLLSQSMPYAKALSSDQTKALSEGVLYYNTEDCSSSGSPTTTSTASGSVYILGDSITVRAESDYQQAFQQAGFTTVNIDGSSSRSLDGPGIDGNKLSGMNAIKQDKSEIQQASAIVVALGTNGGNTKQSIDSAIAALKADNSSAPIFWVDTFVYGRPSYVPTIDAANAAIYGSTGYTVLSWAKTVDKSIDPQNERGATDSNNYIDPSAGGLGVHPTPAGSKALANLVVGSVSKAAPANGPSSSGQPASCCASPITPTPGGSGGSDNAKTAFDYLVSQGLTTVAAAGMVGNWQQESGSTLDTHANNGSHIGIAQWDTTSRWPALLSYEKGKDPYALSTQLDFAMHELHTGYKARVLDLIQKSATPKDAALIVYNNYEVATGDGTGPKREGNAVNVYNLYAGSAPVSNPSGGCPSTASVGTPNFVDLSSGTHFGNGKLTKINVLLIHYTEGNSEGAALQSFFNSNGLGIQFNIGLKGTVYQYFPLNDMQLAWQAFAISTHAIGIEITGMDGEALLNNQVQFNSVVSTVKYLCDYYKIPCSDPKGDITNTSEPNAQGLLGHSEAPGNDHSDPDTRIVNGVAYNITTGKVWTSADRSNSAIHAYMMKLRKALGYNPTP